MTSKFYKYILFFLSIVVLNTGCLRNFEDANINPNEPEQVPTTTLMMQAQFDLLDNIRDEWFLGRMAQVWVEYWTQTNYTTEDRYSYRENSNNEAFKSIYSDLMNLKRIIEYNTDEVTKGEMAQYGDNGNQIAASRILLSWTFMLLADTYGPIPYYSYGANNPKFNALGAKDDLLSPDYISQKEVYLDILKELRESADMLNLDEKVFIEGDNIYNGDASKWKLFANSMILRLAVRLRPIEGNLGINTTEIINTAIKSGVMEGNEDSAMFTYLTGANNSSPLYRAYEISGRKDFTLSKQFVDLLKGDVGPFKDMNYIDPRLYYYGAPRGVEAISVVESVTHGAYMPDESSVLTIDKNDPNPDADFDPADYSGTPYGVGDALTGMFGTTQSSFPNAPIQETYSNPFMEYSEVCFLLSEINGWDQEKYKEGVVASMERWGISADLVNTYIEALPDANEENVMTQKYIALYMQPYQSWAEYRRTGYPNTVVKPGEVSYVGGDIKNIDGDPIGEVGKEYVFESLVSDVTNDLPARVKFPQEEQLLNPSGYKKGVDLLGARDLMSTKLIWDVN